MPEAVDRGFLDLVGGEEGCRRLAQAFYARVAKSDELKPLFPGKSVRCATEEFAAFLIQFLEGDPSQAQYRWWLSLRESHARFQIGEAQRMEWLGLMCETIQTEIGDEEVQSALTQFFHSTSSYVVGRGEVEPEHTELRRRWSEQVTLDKLIELITEGIDADAIELARKFSSRPSVLVGILARMMETGRVKFSDFAIECIEGDPKLGTSRFNGRTLLHFAAGSSCLPVVRLLLSVGGDPDVLENGGHTPLYRAAASGRSESVQVIEELIRAGASVDFTRSVNRSTPLHQAARFGNLGAAEALLAGGANRDATDKNGLTPLDRALKCRREQIAHFFHSVNKSRFTE